MTTGLIFKSEAVKRTAFIVLFFAKQTGTIGGKI